jgi:hypothetical protein
MIEAASCSSSSSPGALNSRSATAGATPAPLTARELIALCEQVLTSFNAVQQTLDSHLDTALQALQQQHGSAVLNADEAAFIREVCTDRVGCVRSCLALLLSSHTC